jgi:hypothetical protein
VECGVCDRSCAVWVCVRWEEVEGECVLLLALADAAADAAVAEGVKEEAEEEEEAEAEDAEAAAAVADGWADSSSESSAYEPNPCTPHTNTHTIISHKSALSHTS